MSMLLGLVVSFSQNAWAESDELVFGILRDGDSPTEQKRVDDYVQAIEGLRDHLGPEVEIRIPVEYMQPPRLSEDKTRKEEQEAKLKSLLSLKDLDYIIVSGPVGAKVASDYGKGRFGLSKPVFAPTIYDGQLQELSVKQGDNSSGIKNFHYIDIPYTFENDLAAFSEIVPFSNLAVVVDEQVVEMLGNDFKKNLLRRFPQMRNIEILPVGTQAAPLISNLAILPETIEAIYITETYSMEEKQRQVLIDNLNNLKKPTFSRLGKKDVEMGVFGGLMHQDTQQARTAFLQESIKKHYLDNTPLKDLPISLNVYGNLMLNIKTTAAIGISLSWDILAEAKQIDGRTGYGGALVAEKTEELSLQSVLNISNEHPLLRAEKDKGGMLEHDIGKNTAKALPQLDLNIGGFLNDPDRADQSLNFVPWYNVHTGIQLRQTLYSPSTQSAIRLSQERYNRSAEDINRKKEVLRLSFAHSYMQLCYAFAQENAHREMLGRVRNIYEIAVRRSEENSALHVDVLQLDAELQQYKRRVLDAQARTRQMEISLNQVMWRSLELSAQLNPIDTKLEVPGKEALLMGYMKDPQSFPVFSKVLLTRGKSSNIDMQVKRAQQEYKRLELEEAKSTAFDPTIGAYGGARWNLAQPYDERFDGELLKDTVAQRDNLDWTAGVYVQVPIFDGLYKKHELSQKYANVASENHQVKAAERNLEAGIRQMLIDLNTWYRSIAFNKKSEERAYSGFQVVLSEYERGNIDVRSVISVQKVATESHLEHIQSLYSFRLGFLTLLGEVGLLDYYSDQKVSEEIFEELNTVYRQNGFKIPSLVR